MDFQEILYQFSPNKLLKDIKPFGNGHINLTFKVIYENDHQEYILQKINTNVFKNPSAIINNHLRLQEIFYLDQDEMLIPKLIPTKNENFLYRDKEQNVWRLTNYIDNSYSVEVVKNEQQAFEAGKGFGWFAKKCSHLNPSDFTEAIKDFHLLSFRIGQLNEAIEFDKVSRYKTVKHLIEFYKNREKPLLKIEELINSNEIPLRVVHNDTKINNLLFRDTKAIAVIDLDTVGPGVIFYDYGDAIRTITNTVAEDEKNIDLVDFNLKFFESFTKGYLLQIDSILNFKERELLYRTPVLMTYIMGIRFLADYLNGDIYYKTSYEEHNLVRSLVQKKLIERIELNENHVKEIIKKYINCKEKLQNK